MNIPTNARPSTRILKDLLKVRKELIKVENSNQPFVSKIDPLMKKDYFLSDALVRYLCYEMNIEINLKLEEEDGICRPRWLRYSRERALQSPRISQITSDSA